MPRKGTEDCCSALRGEALSAFIYTHACRKTQKLLNQSFPLSASLAGWRLPVQFRAEADKLLQDNGDDSSSRPAWVDKHRTVPPARAGTGVARAALCQNGARTHPACSSGHLEPGGDNAPRCYRLQGLSPQPGSPPGTGVIPRREGLGVSFSGMSAPRSPALLSGTRAEHQPRSTRGSPPSGEQPSKTTPGSAASAKAARGQPGEEQKQH